MKSTFFISIAIVIFQSWYSVAQPTQTVYPFEKWKPAEYSAANTAKDAAYLTQAEKNVIFYINLVRINSKLFAQTYAQKFIDSTGMKKTIYVTSLMNTLKTQQSLKPLTTSKELSDIAKPYAIQMGKDGTIGHKDSEKRFAVLKSGYQSRGENCDYGSNDALAIVMSMLIDDGVSSYGHRENILDKEYNLIGVSIQLHKKYKYTCVMDFIYLKAQ